MSKKIICVLLALTLMLAGIPITVGAAGTVTASVTYRIDNTVTDSLNPGHLSAALQILNTGAGPEFIAAVVYYDSEGNVLDFTTEKKTISLYGSIVLSMDIPTTVGNDCYVRTLLMEAATLAPYVVNGSKIVRRGPITDVETGYDGIFERYYTLDSENGSIAMNGDAVTAAETGTLFRLKDMGEGWVGFADANALKRRLDNNDGAVIRRLYGFGGNSKLWKLTSAGDGKYTIENYSGGYLAIEDGEVVLSETPCEFELTLAGETPFTLITGLDGFKLMSEAEQQRVIEICTSAGAGVFPNGTNETTLLEQIESKFSNIYDLRETMTPEKQKDEILDALSSHVKYNSGTTSEMNSVNINALPGGNAETSKSAVKRETLYIWDTGEKEYRRIDVTYTGSGHSQTVKFYYDETGETNVKTAIEALARFPYEYRQFITQVNVYVPASSFTYNCDGHILTVRVSDGSGVETMARNFAHELGHSIEFLANGAAYEKAETHWCHSAEWQQALTDDIIPVSIYGSTNDDEGLAEFARLYFQCYGHRDRMIGLKQLYPNRYASFVRLLNAVGMEALY